jgi:hypothetical protein
VEAASVGGDRRVGVIAPAARCASLLRQAAKWGYPPPTTTVVAVVAVAAMVAGRSLWPHSCTAALCHLTDARRHTCVLL